MAVIAHLTTSDVVWLARGAIKTGTMGPDKAVAAPTAIFYFYQL
jgi:hypothetical protein